MTDPPNEDPARVAPDFLSDEAMPLDAIVGGFDVGVRPGSWSSRSVISAAGPRARQVRLPAALFIAPATPAG